MELLKTRFGKKLCMLLIAQILLVVLIVIANGQAYSNLQYLFDAEKLDYAFKKVWWVFVPTYGMAAAFLDKWIIGERD